MKILDHLLGFRRTKLSLDADPFPITDLELPSTLGFALNRVDISCLSSIHVGGEIESGQPIWAVDAGRVHPSPVSGKVVEITDVADIRGRGLSPAVIVEPDRDTSPEAFSPLDQDRESSLTLRKRIEEASVMTGHFIPRSLAEELYGGPDGSAEAVVVLCVDREPGVSVFAQLFRERSREAASAAALLGKIAGTKRIFMALPEKSEMDGEALSVCRGEGVEILYIVPKYPEALDAMVASRADAGERTKVIGVEAALAAFDAVKLGKVQDKKVLTVIGPDNKPVGNYRISIGTSLGDIFSELGLSPEEGDKVVAGGPMKGFAQYSLEGTVDSGINSLMLIPDSSVVPWKVDPCVNCGKCVDICPVNLQAHLIGLYSEFRLFERTEELDIDQCLECGLCASVCVSGRPLSQFIDLAKNEIRKDAQEEGDAEEDRETCRREPGTAVVTRRNPAMSVFSGTPRFTVGLAPHWRTGTNLTKMNFAFILALLPAVLVSAVSQFFGPGAVGLDAVGPVNGLLKTLVVEMGLDAGFLWFSGILGTILFSMGLGVLTEYICQAVMRQPYHVTNGHGALMGLLVALLMPPGVPLWIAAVAIVTAIFAGKQIFGGIGGYPMHPALVGWLVVLLSWPQYIYPIGSISIASVNTAVIAATAAGGLALWLAGYIRIEAPLGVIAGAAIFSFIFQDKLDAGVAEQLLTGHVFLAAFFLATDSTCAPANKMATWIHGLGIGALIMLIRAYGIWPDAVPFAVLLMNVLRPLVDRIRPRVKKLAIQPKRSV